jgi:hypothetical protein
MITCLLPGKIEREGQEVLPGLANIIASFFHFIRDTRSTTRRYVPGDRRFFTREGFNQETTNPGRCGKICPIRNLNVNIIETRNTARFNGLFFNI